nr:MAG TPA: hypothetical protein [Caudoviricetes sp.]
MVRMVSLFTPQQKNQGTPKLVYLEILSPSDNRCGKWYLLQMEKIAK